MILLVASLLNPYKAKAAFFSVFTQLFASNNINVSSASGSFNSQTVPVLKADSSPNPNYGVGGGDVTIVDNSLVAQDGPLGAAADIQDQPSNNQISTYVVQDGDTISQIAQMFDVSVNTIVWANDLQSQKINPGQTLIILPVSGVVHTVQKGDTVESIAKKYNGDVNEVLQFNDLSPGQELVVGQAITIPDGESPTRTGQVYTNSGPSNGSSKGSYYINQGHKFFLASDGSSEPVHGTGGPDYVGYYMKPVDGVLTQGLHGYNAVDLGAPIGTPILAAASGVVIVSKMGGWNGGYGNYVVISHPNKTQTLYAHMKQAIVSSGESVYQGQVIGYVGLTGMTTGSHLHFEVRGAYNPFQ